MKERSLARSVAMAALLLLMLGACKKEKQDDPLNTETSMQQNPAGELRSCGAPEEFERQLQADPDLKNRMAAMELSIQSKLASRSTTTQPVVIPIVIHLLYNTAAQNISDAQILSQITVLNNDFARTNSDAANTPEAFKPVASATNIQFCLAQRDPNGNPTTGIIRKFTNTTSWTANGACKLSSQGGDDAWPCTQYLNIWVCNLTGYLGYATYPGGNPIADGVVIRYNAFGNTGTLLSPYDKGRTATHEVAHWLNVYHIWGDAQCGDDLINDSPTQERSNYGCPTFPHRSACTSADPNGDMFMNYMDYSNDACMNMFTAGQAARMNATLLAARSSILTSLGGVPPAGAACSVPDGPSASAITTNSATLTWRATSASSYNVRYKPTTSTNWTSLNTAATSANISGLSASTVYEFQVQSVCASNSSAYSASASFTTLTPVCNIPGGLAASALTTNSATLSWGATGAVSYMVRYKPVSSSTWTAISLTGTSHNISGLASSTAYEFQVQSICAWGSSAYSASSGFTTLTQAVASCNTPGGLSASSITFSSATLSWVSTGAVSYNVRYKLTSSSIWINTTSTAASRNISGLAPLSTYEFQIRSVCNGAYSNYSPSASFTTAAKVRGNPK